VGVAVAEVVSVALLFMVLTSAVMRPFGWPEAVAAVPAAAIVVAIGAISAADARSELSGLGPVVAFLAAVLVLGRLCADEGLFAWCGAWMAHVADGQPRRLLTAVFVVASVITAVFSLDATVVLLTPVVFATVARLGVRTRPHLYACGHLSNTASVLLPVSNLTNLLAFSASGLSFLRFSGLMALPWIVAVAVEYIVLRRFFAPDLRGGNPTPRHHGGGPGRTPWFPILAVCATLAGFVTASAAGISPAWAAAAGALLLAVPGLLRRNTSVDSIVKAAEIPFLVFVLALGLVVRAVVDNGLGDALHGWVPHHMGLPELLGLAALSAVLANVINNLPAVLVLIPLATGSGSAAVLAVLIGVNIGPNLTYTGSLATMLWRRIARQHNHNPSVQEFTTLGLLTAPAAIAAAVVALWVSLRMSGS
jgi:arsenical pump membrane protein